MLVNPVWVLFMVLSVLFKVDLAYCAGGKGDATILRPNIMCAVPTVLDKIYKGINSKVSASGPFMAKLVDFCVRYRATWVRRGYDTPIMNRLIFSNP